MKKYTAARSMNLLITALGWISIALAAMIGSGGYGLLGSAVAVGVAVPLAVGGLAMIALAQLTAAQLDTAENTGRIVEAIERLVGQQAPATQTAKQEMPPMTRAKVEPRMRGLSGSRPPGDAG